MTRIKQMSKERLGKIALYITADIFVIVFSLMAALVVWRHGIIPGANIIGMLNEDWRWLMYIAPVAVLLTLCVNTIMRLYSNLWKYASIDEMLKIFVASTVVFALLFTYDWFFIAPMNLVDISRRMYFLAWASNTFLFAFTRFGYRFIKRAVILLGHLISSKAGARRVLVVGASFSGYGIVKSMQTNPVRDRIPVLVIDPDEAKNNTSLLGVRVVSGLGKIPELAEQYEVDEIIIAIPAGAPDDLRTALDSSAKTGLRVKIMPPMEDVTDSRTVNSNLRDVNVSDLLYRDEVKLNIKNISAYLGGKVVLVTGGGGTIGSELCRQIAPFFPKCLVILELYENNAFELINELNDLYGDTIDIKLRLGSIQDMPRLIEVFDELRPDVVFHAAAHKHVMIIEENQSEAIKNNVLGTINAAVASVSFNTERFVLISSDKAVNPANAYGATKRVAELVVTAMAEGYCFARFPAAREALELEGGVKTRFMTVRFGNVLGASGSVLHLFKRQIAAGGPVKITGPSEMTRYFMTVPEACRLVLTAAGLDETGKILILDMGEPVKVEDLAKKMIMLCGYTPGEDIMVINTNLRPGDKLAEELITDEEKENMRVVCDGKIFVTKPLNLDFDKLEDALVRLKDAALSGGDVNPLLRELVPEYK